MAAKSIMYFPSSNLYINGLFLLNKFTMSISNFPSPIALTDSKSKITGVSSSVIPAMSLISFSTDSLSASGI